MNLPCLYPGCKRFAPDPPMRQTCARHREAWLIRRRRSFVRVSLAPARLRALDAKRAKRGGICADCRSACADPIDCARILSERLVAQRPAWDWRDRPSEEKAA